MLQPKRSKFRKMHKGRIHGEAKGGSLLNFGSFGLKAVEPERITARQIEAARRAMTRHMKRQGRVWIRIGLIWVLIGLVCWLLIGLNIKILVVYIRVIGT